MIALAVLCALTATGRAEEPIQLHPDNPHYFLWRGQPTVLITAGEHYGAVMNLDFDYARYLDELKSNRFNLTRVFSGSYREVSGSFNITGNTLAPAQDRYVCPWAPSNNTGDGVRGKRFDLTQWDPAYFDRLKDFVAQANRRGVVVELVLFCTMYDDTVWNASPMNERNNVNGIGNVSRGEVYSGKDKKLLAVQKAVVTKLVTELNSFANVYFEVCNEPYERGGLTQEWNDEIIDTVVAAEATLPKKHLIAQGYPPSSNPVPDLNRRVSILNFHTPKTDAVRMNYGLNRVIALDETGGADRSDRKYRTEGWDWILAGGSVYDHLDFSFTVDRPDGSAVPLPPGTPGGGGPELRRQLGFLKEFIESFDFIRMKPDTGTIKSNHISFRGGNSPGASPATVRVLSVPGREYAIYVNGGVQAQSVLELPAATWKAEWINTKTGQSEKVESFTHHGGLKTLASPDYNEDIALRVTRQRTGETLSNGIVLPSSWPPRLTDFPTSVDQDPMVPSYLVSPPDVISIDVGRQLFVDDFLIAQSTLTRTFHLPKYHPASPVLKPDQPWEMKNPDHAAAAVFSDGVWYDPKDELFKMWYLGGESAATGYATSPDGLRWTKPALDVRPPTNIVQPGGRDSSTVWLDLEEKDPARRFKMFRVIGAGEDPVTGWNNWVMAIHFSADGIHWGEPMAKSGRLVDRSTVFWNPFRKVWVYSIRHVYKTGDPGDKSYGYFRRRSYVEGADVLDAARWEVNEPLRWTDVDQLDPQREDLKVKPHLYNLDAVAYESLMVGFFTVWRGQPADRHKPNNVVLGYSRDGWHWSRPDRRAAFPVSDRQGDWNANNVQSAGGGFLVVGDELYFYVSGRTGRPGNNKAGLLTTGLATLRRDGFASMDAGEAGGTLTTRPVRFTGKHLFVNVADPKGELRVEILDQAGQVLPRFTTRNCVPVTTDKTLQAVRWNGVDDLASLANQQVRFRFHLQNGQLFAFWVSPERTGASQGYVAAGGPGFPGHRDQVRSEGRRN